MVGISAIRPIVLADSSDVDSSESDDEMGKCGGDEEEEEEEETNFNFVLDRMAITQRSHVPLISIPRSSASNELASRPDNIMVVDDIIDNCSDHSEKEAADIMSEAEDGHEGSEAAGSDDGTSVCREQNDAGPNRTLCAPGSKRFAILL